MLTNVDLKTELVLALPHPVSFFHTEQTVDVAQRSKTHESASFLSKRHLHDASNVVVGDGDGGGHSMIVPRVCLLTPDG